MDNTRVTMEELLDKVDCRYELVAVVSKRAKQLVDGAMPLEDCGNVKPVIQATKELADEAFAYHHAADRTE